MTAEKRDPYCLRDGESAALLAAHPWRRFGVLGDSVAEGRGDPVAGYSPLSWADRISAELARQQPHLAYLNLGKHGERAAEVRATQLDRMLGFRPDLAVVVCGGNDAFPRSYDGAAVDRELEAMITALQAIGAVVLTIGMFDISASPHVPDWLRPGLRTRMAELAERTRALGGRLGTCHVHLTEHPLATDPSIYSADGLHGNARSHAIAAAETIRRLAAWSA